PYTTLFRSKIRRPLWRGWLDRDHIPAKSGPLPVALHPHTDSGHAPCTFPPQPVTQPSYTQSQARSIVRCTPLWELPFDRSCASRPCPEFPPAWLFLPVP